MNRYKEAKHSKEIRKDIKFISIAFIVVIVAISIYIVLEQYKSNKNQELYDQIDTVIADDKEIFENLTTNTNVDIGENANTNVNANQNMNVDTNINTNTNQAMPDTVKKAIYASNANEDIIGWIKIDNTVIDYPLLQSLDNSYYLTHNYKKEKSTHGSIFLKSECDFKDKNSNLIIYGHSMKDGSMFKQLLDYKDKTFFNLHKTIKIATKTEEYKYQIVAVFKSKIYYQDEQDVFKYYNQTRFEDEQEYNRFVNNAKKEGLYDTGVSAKYGEQLITLITCEYSQENRKNGYSSKKSQQMIKF